MALLGSFDAYFGCRAEDLPLTDAAFGSTPKTRLLHPPPLPPPRKWVTRQSELDGERAEARKATDGAPPHIANPVKQLLKRPFGNARIISRHFPTAWPSRSPDLNPLDFWMWGYLKAVVFSNPIAHLAELKARIAQHILNVIPETLRSVVEHAVSRFQLIAENGGQHIEHVLHQSREI
ncbi:hypothetical protein AVEN_33068-1 [Araneus ventricosus]|uniref:Tc1-like transposase DDE domain-containing protein n=1 Tax=Araneus ventricosus TaxID=182803 RepID=A0A4Y2Q0H3_ARAVE|nr:hypothetical protein AVEN_33068-1 [Araneus ventricosus]